MDTRQLRRLLADPPVEFRPQPVWSLNSVLTRERLTEMLEQFKQQGMGGVFVLPRWGLVQGFLTEEWFEMWGHALRECRRLGLGCQIYDEFVCPSGSAGGHTIAQAPHTAARFLEATVHTRPARPAGETVAAFALDRDFHHMHVIPAGTLREALDHASPAHPVMTLGLATDPAQAGCGGLPRPDTSRHDATASFIKAAYEPYARRYGGQFGKTIRYVFTDEPSLPVSGSGPLWSDLLSREFRKDHGYRLEDRLAEFCFGREGATAARFDYFSTLNRLFCTNYARQIYEWCEAHGIDFTGHYNEHEWLNPADTPDAMALRRWMHAPGNDYLAFQIFPDDLPANRMHRFNLRELASVANQLGRDKTMVESSGAGGYSISFPTFKACEDLLLAHGVNVMNPHLSHVSLAGMRQYEWPQTLTDHSSWFPWYRLHADHVARVAAVLSQGREVNRVLLLQPTTTLWMHYEHPAFHPGQGPVSPTLKAIGEGHFDVFFALADRQVDFDLGDEAILAELGKARGRKLAVGRCAYDLVVVPHVMENWTQSTIGLMKRYLQNGGRIVQLGDAAPTHVDGRPSPAPAELRERYAGQWESAADAAELATRVAELVPPRLTARDGGPLPEGLAWRRAATPDGQAVWFFCNPWNRTMTMDVRVSGRQLLDLDTASGAVRCLPAERDGGSVVMPLTLGPRGHALWLARNTVAADVPATPAPWRGTAVPLGKPEIVATRPNQLLLDYCDIETGHVRRKDTTTFRADDANWRVQGFPCNPWRLGSTQFDRNFADHELDDDSPFRVMYHFEIDPKYPPAGRAGIALAVERPWLYTVKVNGRLADFAKASPWFDEHVRALPVGRLVKPGVNAVELVAPRFHMLCEIKPIYILGDFGLAAARRGFRIVAPRPPKLGDWTRQGLPFYPHGVRYAWPFVLDRPAARLRLKLGQWAGSVASVLLDGKQAGAILHPPYALEIAGPVAGGSHEIAVEVIGNMRNMLGPHFNEGHAGPWSWQWGAPEASPPGKAYTLQPSGLLDTPRLSACAVE
jgi:hypothetical protein